MRKLRSSELTLREKIAAIFREQGVFPVADHIALHPEARCGLLLEILF